MFKSLQLNVLWLQSQECSTKVPGASITQSNQGDKEKTSNWQYLAE